MCDQVDRVPLARLEREWQVLLGGRLEALFRRWRSEPALAAFDSPAAALRFLRQPGLSPPKDAVLAALLRQARREPLAGRFVLEALLPGLKNLSRRLLAHRNERDAVWCLLLACAWERIATYPLERRPTRIAANVLLDTLHDALAYLRVEARQRRELVPQGSLAHGAGDKGDADVERLLRKAVALGAITASEAELILATRIDGGSLTAEAETAGVAYNTMKLRRQRAERRLLVFLGYPPVPRGAQRRPFSSRARQGEAHRVPPN